MKRIAVRLALALAVLVGCASAAVAAQLAFVHVNVVDVRSGRILADRTVVIDGNRIASITRGGRIPTGARTIDATHNYLIPGLWDMHAHDFNYISGRPPRTWQFPFFIANGVTGVRDMWVKPKDMPLIRKWRAELNRGDFIGPRFGAVGTIVDGPEDAKPGHFPGPNVQVLATPEDARKAVDELQAAGIDFIKPYNSLSRDVYLAMVHEARLKHFPVAGHTPWAVGARLASDSGQRSIEHLTMVPEGCSTEEPKLVADSVAWKWSFADARIVVDTYDPRRCEALAKRFARNHTAVTPTFVVNRTLSSSVPIAVYLADPRIATVPKDERNSWQGFIDFDSKVPPDARKTGARWWSELFAITRLMQQHGVMILAGTDVGNAFIYPGSSLHDELGFLHDAGLTPLQALQAATLNPAKFLGIEKHFGTVDPGKTADLVLLDANPLADIANTRRISAVVLNGRLFDRKALDTLVAQSGKGNAAQ